MNCKILIITNKQDYTADFVIKHLHERAICFFRFNTEDFPIKYSTSLNISKSNFNIQLKSDKISLNVDEIKGIWYRRPVKPQFSEIKLSDDDKDFAIREASEFLNNLWAVMDNKNWVSSPYSLRIAERKAYQLVKAKIVGFDIPKTSISNDPKLILNFYKHFDRQVIVKPISHGDFSNGMFAIFANDLSSFSNIPDFNQAFLSPFIIQEKIAKVLDIRSTVIGRKVFSFEIRPKNNIKLLDWRTLNPNELEYKFIETPESVQLKIFNLMNLFNISFAALDFAYTKSKKWIFLEMNPNGQWAWLEQMTGVCMSNSLIEFLLSGY